MSKRRAGPAPSTDPVDELEQSDVELYELEDVDVPSSIPLRVRRSLREVLGDEGEQVERVWLEMLGSETERTRLEAAKVLTQAAVALAKSGEGNSAALLIPKRAEDVELLTLEEAFAAMAAIYVAEMEVLRKRYGEEEAISRFRQDHYDLELPLALLQRALGLELS
jgi:hypothetical protein